MNKDIYLCYKSSQPCSGTWGCQHLTTPPPKGPEEKEQTFIKVYREAKTKEILSCPNFKSANIDIILDKMF